jgi:hypothetical protein
VTIGPCTNTPPTPGVVVYNQAQFLASYPEFTATNTAYPTALANNFLTATLLLNNSCCSRVVDVNVRQQLLYMLTAHLTALYQGVNGQPPQGVVGRVSDATEGSVSMSAEYASTVSMSAAFYLQTQYGATFWASTVTYRTMTYVAAPPRCYGPYGSFGAPFQGYGGYGGWC